MRNVSCTNRVVLHTEEKVSRSVQPRARFEKSFLRFTQETLFYEKVWQNLFG